MPNIIMADQPSGGYERGVTGVDGSIVIGGLNNTPQTVTGDVIVDMPGCRLDLERFLQSATKDASVGPFKLKIKCASFTTSTNYLCYDTKAINEVEIELTNSTFAWFSTGSFQGANCRVATISGTPISLKGSTVSSASNTSYLIFKDNTRIANLTFYENLSGANINFGTCSAFTNDTLVSLANGLQIPSDTAVLKLHSTPKGRLASIMGTVESVTRGEETYDRFVADENGTVSLQDFITTTKGWTLT